MICYKTLQNIIKYYKCILEVVARLPSDRTVTSYLTILLFLSLDKAELYSEKEPFIQVSFWPGKCFLFSNFYVQRVKSLEYKMEMSLKVYLESSQPGYQAGFLTWGSSDNFTN